AQLVAALRSPAPVAPNGVARALRLLTDACSPLYAPAEPPDLRHAAGQGLWELDPVLRPPEPAASLGSDASHAATWSRSRGRWALATGRFLQDQRPGGSAFVIGESGVTTALHDAGYTLSERDPDYVVLGETRTYSFERITHAIRLVDRGARFIATNPDTTGPSPDGPLPATGSVAALVSRATGVDPYYVGKPN